MDKKIVNKNEEYRESLRLEISKCVIVLLLILEVVVVVMFFFVVFPRKAHAADGEPWKNWGAAPFAISQEEACKKAVMTIDGFTMPTPVKKHFKQATCKDGSEAWLMPNQLLEQMWSGPDSHHKEAYLMNKKPVAELPVLKSPDGRKYRKGSVAETARALSWTFVYEGNTYVLYLPFACFNWSWGFVATPIEQCAEVVLTVPAGISRTVRFTTDRRKPISDFNCWGVIEREWRSGAPRNCDWCIWTRDGIAEMERLYGGTFDFYHTSIYQMHPDSGETAVTLVFPLVARDGGVSVCVEVDGNIYDAALVLPPTWKDGTRVTIPADFWAHPRVINP